MKRLAPRRDPYWPRLTANKMSDKCIHSYQVFDGLIPYDVEAKIGEVCGFCKEIVQDPIIRLHKRYGYCTHSWQVSNEVGTKTTREYKICSFCGERVEPLREGFRWEELRPDSLWFKMMAIKPLIVVGSQWFDKVTQETFTIKEIKTFFDNEYPHWECFIDPHPEGTHWYASPESLAETYELL